LELSQLLLKCDEEVAQDLFDWFKNYCCFVDEEQKTVEKILEEAAEEDSQKIIEPWEKEWESIQKDVEQRINRLISNITKIDLRTIKNSVKK
jgi:Txe/YoeB family toxin of Txe-Axe toxin-antitoxin module